MIPPCATATATVYLTVQIPIVARDPRRRQQVVGGTNQTEIVSMKLDVSQAAQRPEGVSEERFA